MVLLPQCRSGLSTPGSETPWQHTAVPKPVSPPPSGLPTELPSHASAPGVPGGPATAQAVAPLPGAVDEAQGVFKFLLDGSFLDGLVRKVDLCLDKQKTQGLQAALPRRHGRPSGPSLHTALGTSSVLQILLLLGTQTSELSSQVCLEFTG